jgi:hypothetical protein
LFPSAAASLTADKAADRRRGQVARINVVTLFRTDRDVSAPTQDVAT